MSSTEEALIVYWANKLGLTERTWRLARVDPRQVVGEDGSTGHELVGVVDGDPFTICTTRPLDEEDVVHELLHVAYPLMSEAMIVELTDYYMEGVVT